jgi:hypothetical protein
MARLPRFQESGLISADIPRLDFSGARESAGFSQAITSSLDKITEFALGKIKAEQDMQNKILGIQMRGDLEADAQRRFAELNLELSRGQRTDIGEMTEEIKALSGLAVSLARISPEQANGLMNSINSGGKALLTKTADVLTKAYGAQADQRTDSAIDDIKYNLETTIRYADSLETIEEYEAQARAIIFASAVNNPDTLTSKMADFEKARVAARQSAMVSYFGSDEFATSPARRLEKLRQGDVGQFMPLWDKMDTDARNKVIDKMNSRAAQDYEFLDREQKLTEQVNKVADIDDYDSMLLGEISGEEYLNRVRERGSIPSQELIRSIRSGDHSGANEQQYGQLESLALKGQLSENKLDQYAKDRRISWKQANSLRRIILGADRKDLQDGMREIADAFVPNPLDPMTRSGNVRRAEVQSQLRQEFKAAMDAGKPFDAFRRAQELIKGRRGQEDLKQLEDARTRLRTKLESVGVAYREDLTDEDLRRAGVNRNDIRVIRRIMTSIEALK